ncbi:hypothetical protein AG1IA_06432 [Rhizoctonia solani AG-1 IA]|uniref:Uncharacterized protein n=1 Tax=Thanatephorus cucumeris (strain AG1-IA) TaxID=983506 RepID=L8WS19_THACA|nr:hypothetical protein AG1IA_06432 [Rhizoctonia solani AG-1 IA]
MRGNTAENTANDENVLDLQPHPPPTTHPTRPRICPPPEHPSLRLPTYRMRLAAAWTAYECRWAGLQAPIPSAPTTPLTFHNVPWPVGFQPDSARSLTPDRIKKFLLSSSHSPHRSPKERLKSALSLWRPEQWEDKWINNVEPSERTAEGGVEERVNRRLACAESWPSSLPPPTTPPTQWLLPCQIAIWHPIWIPLAQCATPATHKTPLPTQPKICNT